MASKRTYQPINELLMGIVDNRGKSVPTVDKGFPLIATNCIKHSSIYPTFENIRYVSDETLGNWFRAHLLPNDILFVNKGTPGRVCVVPNPVTFCAAQDMIAFRCDPQKVYYKYLLAALRSPEIQKKISNFHVGLVIPHFKKQDLENLLIPIVSIKEQINIGDLYFTLSEKIELNNRINAELEAMAKTIYDYWFVQFDFPHEFKTVKTDKNGRRTELVEVKPYKSSGGTMVWNEELKREIPEGWEVKRLEDCMRIVRGSSPRPIDDFMSETGAPWIKISDATSIDHWFIIETKEFIREEGVRHSRELKPGTLILSNSASPGIPRIVQIRSCVHDGWLIVDSFKNGLYNEFMLFYFENFRSKILNMGSGSIFKNLKTEYIKDLRIALPPEELLESSRDIFRRNSGQILNYVKQNQQLTSLRDWLLPMLMNGQITIN